jgi:hypothetical protein
MKTVNSKSTNNPDFNSAKKLKKGIQNDFVIPAKAEWKMNRYS